MKAERRLAVARYFWLVLAAAHCAVWLASLPGFFARVAAGTVPLVVSGGKAQVSAQLVGEWAGAWHLTPAAWAWLDTLVSALCVLSFTRSLLYTKPAP